jgi:hypothetical protein
VIGRFVPFVRTYITVVAGVTQMERRRFMTWSSVGAVLWVFSITLLGYFLGNTLPWLGENIDNAILAILAFSVIPVAFEWWKPTIFAEMSALAVRTGRSTSARASPTRRPGGGDRAAVAAHARGRNQYAPGPGIPELRQAIAEHQQRHYGLDPRPGHPGGRDHRRDRGDRRPRCSGWSTPATRSSCSSRTTTPTSR